MIKGELAEDIVQISCYMQFRLMERFVVDS
jgi:hypothetical protein